MIIKEMQCMSRNHYKNGGGKPVDPVFSLSNVKMFSLTDPLCLSPPVKAVLQQGGASVSVEKDSESMQSPEL